MLVYCHEFGSFFGYLVKLFFFNDTATTEIYPLSLHDALPISSRSRETPSSRAAARRSRRGTRRRRAGFRDRSEEHTSELQSQSNLVCRLLLEKKMATVAICPAIPFLIFLWLMVYRS